MKVTKKEVKKTIVHLEMDEEDYDKITDTLFRAYDLGDDMDQDLKRILDSMPSIEHLRRLK
jgi:hypothetical protein